MALLLTSLNSPNNSYPICFEMQELSPLKQGGTEGILHNSHRTQLCVGCFDGEDEDHFQARTRKSIVCLSLSWFFCFLSFVTAWPDHSWPKDILSNMLKIWKSPRFQKHTARKKGWVRAISVKRRGKLISGFKWRFTFMITYKD